MTARRKHRLRMAVSTIASLWLASGWLAPPAIAADPPPAAAAPSTAPSRPARPYWIELALPQREALAPLEQDWERLDVQTKKKWVEIANRYPKMTPDEQGRTQQRMREWAMLTPDQRRVARDSFARVRSMSPEQRADMLRKYHELPDEKKQSLTTEGRASKVIVVPKPMPPTSPRRSQLSEGALVRNPALAAQKAANPLVAPARPVAKPAEFAAPAAAIPPPAAVPGDPVKPTISP